MERVIKLSLWFGILGGVGYFLFFLLMNYTTSNPLSHKIEPMGLQFILVFYSIWYLKKKNNGYLHFYEAFTIGFVTNLTIALLSGLLMYLFLQFIDSTPFDTWIKESYDFLVKDRVNKKEIMSDEAYQRMLASIQNSKPTTVIVDRLMTSFWLVFLIGLFSLALRKIRPI